jgi:hypothetical protein
MELPGPIEVGGPIFVAQAVKARRQLFLKKKTAVEFAVIDGADILLGIAGVYHLNMLNSTLQGRAVESGTQNKQKNQIFHGSYCPL